MSVAPDTNNQHPPLNSESKMEANRPLNTNEQHQDNDDDQPPEPPGQDSEKQLESGEQQNTSPQSGDQESVKDLSGNGKATNDDGKKEQHKENQSSEGNKCCEKKTNSNDAKREKKQSSDSGKSFDEKKCSDAKLEKQNSSKDQRDVKPEKRQSSGSRTPRALVIIAEGSEESEAVITIDMLRRSGVEVTLAGLNGSDAISGDNKIKIIPDKSLEEARNEEFDAVIIPGGSGVESIRKSSTVKELLQKAEERNSVIAAICGGPKALDGVCKNCEITCYPPLKDDVKEAAGKDHKLCLDRVHIDKEGKLITSQAPGTAFEFSNALIKQLCGEKVAHDIMEKMLVSTV